VIEVDLYEPFKSFISTEDLECLKKEIKPNLRQNNSECTYAHSDDLWMYYRRTMEKIAQTLVNME